MERAIDRTSYRRSARTNVRSNEKENDIEVKKKDKKFKITNMILNQTIVSLLIIVGILTAQYFEMTDITEWIRKNLSNGYSATQIVSKIKNKYLSNHDGLFAMMASGEMSGEVSSTIASGEIKDMDTNWISGEIVSSGELMSAVEGINQMSEDAHAIRTNYELYLPLKGTITSEFGSRVSDSPIVSSYHTGLDIAANTGTEIHAAHSGKVTMAKMFSSYGNCVMIEDGNLITVYAHCSSLDVGEGQDINRGDVIAKVGMTGNATGPHLHFEVRYEGRFVDPKEVLSGL